MIRPKQGFPLYGIDFDKGAHRNELDFFLFLTFFSSKDKGKVSLKDAHNFVQDLSRAQRTIYKLVCSVARLMSLPATNAANERSFSSMNRIKTYLCITIGHSFKMSEDIECLQGIIGEETLTVVAN